MSRIETSCTEINVQELHLRQTASSNTSTPPSANTRQGSQEVAPDSAIRTGELGMQKRAAPGSIDPMYNPSGKMTTSSAVLALTTQLAQADTRVGQLLLAQPGFQPVIASAFRDALTAAFPQVRQPLDPEQIYVTGYVNATVVLDGDNHVPERRPTSSASLRQVLQNALNTGRIPTYDVGQTGFFYAAGNAVNNPAEIVPGMETTAHVMAFENVLRNTIERRAGEYQNAVKKYWDQTDILNPALGSPKTRLISAVREQRQAEAALRVHEATLSVTGKQLLDQLGSVDQGSGNKPGAFRMALQENGTPGKLLLNGMLLITRSIADRPDTTSGPVLLMAPGQGLMEFASAQEYRNFMQTSLNQQDQRTQLFEYIDDEQRARAARPGHTMSLHYDAIVGPPAAETVQSLLDRQQRDIAFAISSGRQPSGAPDAALRRAGDLHAMFDITNINDTRHLLLVEAFLKKATADDIGKWRTEFQQYQVALKAIRTSGLPSMRQYLDPEFLNTYAANKVREQIKHDLGFDIDPDQVTVTTQIYMEHKPPIPNPTTIRKIPLRQTLTALSLANASQLGDAGWNEMTVTDSDGYAVPHMTHDYLCRMLRAVDIGRHYQELLQAHLLDSAEGTAREKQYMQFLEARLRLDSREAKIRGDISDDSMRQVMAALGPTPSVHNGQPLQARRLSVGGNALGNVLLFGTQAPVLVKHAPQLLPISQAYNHNNIPPDTPFRDTGIAKVILYMPDAPDGKRLREFGSREEMKHSVIRNSAMRDYLRQHARTDRQATVTTGLRNGNVDDEIITGNFLRAAYRMQARQIIEDADARTTTNAEEDRQKRWDRINLALDIAGIFLPPKITIPLSLIRAAISFSDINEALQNDHKDDAWQSFFEGLAHLGSASLDGVTQGGTPGSTKSSTALGPRFHKSARDTGAARNRDHPQPARPGASPAPASTPHSGVASLATPAGMTAVQIDGQTCYYWQSSKNTVGYRDLFQRDPNHPEQLQSAGYGAADTNNVWHKISLRGGGGSQSTMGRLAGRMAERPFNAEVARLIQKVSSSSDGVEYFFATIAGQNRRLIYNLEENAFTDVLPWQQTRYFPRYNEMVPVNPQAVRTVTDSQREATLRALGIDLKLPFRLSAAATTPAAKPIPRVVHSIWVGAEIPAPRRDTILASLENNAVMARQGSHPYEMKLYLSNRNRAAYASNLAHIRTKAPNVSVVVLEDTPFYQRFRHSKYFNQYLAAIDGNGGVATNYASAADVLRYRLLHHEGGLYLDCDDTLTAPPGSIEIRTTANGLALDDPVSNPLLGMDTQYNTSIFGTQKNNPTLHAISEESYRRYLQSPELYVNPRPRRLTAAQRTEVSSDINTANERRLYAYMRKIFHVTGPDVFNKVINEQLPDMRQLREAVKLKAHTWNFSLSLPMRVRIEAAANMALPLGQINQMGNAHTWLQTRR